MLVALYNISLFSYYQLGRFNFAALGFTPEQFGYSEIFLGLGSLLGSYLNNGLLAKHVSQHLLLQAAATLLTLGAVGVYLIQDSIWFITQCIKHYSR